MMLRTVLKKLQTTRSSLTADNPEGRNNGYGKEIDNGPEG